MHWIFRGHSDHVKRFSNVGRVIRYARPSFAATTSRYERGEGREEGTTGWPLQNTRPSSTDLPQLPKMHSYCLPSLCQISNYSGKAILITDYHEFVWHPHHAIPFEHARNSRPSRSWGHHLAMPLSRNARSIGSIGDFEEDAGEVQEVPVH